LKFHVGFIRVLVWFLGFLLGHLRGASFFCSRTDVFLLAKAEAAVETRQVFCHAGIRHSGLPCSVRIGAAKAESAYKAVAGVNDSGYIPHTLTLRY
jgi:hypothetical protein